MFSTNASQVSTAANYIEDVFSAYLYTGNASTQTITNGIDLAGKGGLWWGKQRDSTGRHWLVDTARGGDYTLCSNLTDAQTFAGFGSGFFTSNGVSFNATNSIYNGNGNTYASWTFRKQAKFFDVVTYTGTGAAQTISHNLGAVPGCMIIKCTSTTSAWFVYHRSLDPGGNPATAYLALNTTAAANSTLAFTNTQPTSSVFYVGDGVGQNPINQNGQTYVAYLFAHNAGGFGLTGNDNVISCGSYTGNGSSNGPVINLGWEPQWVLIKRADASGTDWTISDNMRGLSVVQNTAVLVPNSAAAESSTAVQFSPNATGFQLISAGATYNQNAGTYIYIAIRRGPMKVPTSGTSVFAPIAYTGTGAAGQTLTGTSFPPDLSIFQNRPGFGGAVGMFDDRLRGGTAYLPPSSTAAEGNTAGYYIRSFNMDGITYGTSYVDYNYNGSAYVNWLMGRAPGFFDEVCYTGTGSATTVAHNLGVVPEFMIVKRRDSINSWLCYQSALGNDRQISLNLSSAVGGSSITPWNSTTPTNAVFSVGTNAGTNASGGTYVCYLFATCPGVSKVGSYTGTGTTQTINCGFTGGARFVLIKRTDSTGDWYVWDSARGIVAGNDPYLLLNSTAAEVTNTDYVDTYSAGFEISSTAPAAINANGGSYIFWAVA